MPCFRYVITEPPDQIWGHQLPNGTWAGMTGMLHRKVGYKCIIITRFSLLFTRYGLIVCVCRIYVFKQQDSDCTRSIHQ